MAHLHTHDRYSVIDGSAMVEDYLKLAEKDGQESLAITNHGTLGGVIDLYSSAKKHNVKPIAGIELYVDTYELREHNYPGHITVLAKNESGYRSLIAANNLAQRQFYYRPRITLQQIIEKSFASDWIILSGCMSSPLFDWPYGEAANIVKQLQAHAGGFFLEIMWHYSQDEQFNVKQDRYLERIAQLHKDLGVPIVLTNDCHYAYKHQEDIHQQLLRSSRIPSDLEFDGEGFHFKTSKQMQAIADSLGIPNAWDNAVEIGKSCSLVIPEADKINWYVPDITGGHPEEIVTKRCEEILAAKKFSKEYWERYSYELSILRTSPSILNSYLVAMDVIDWCTERSIPAAARGSMAGSLVSYLLGITQEDPIKYNLSFSRAVNPARPTIPDFDLDVSSIHRSEILDYLKERYAGNTPICAYTHFGPKGALRKVLRMEATRDPININQMSKALPEDWAGGEFAYSPTHKKYIGTAKWSEFVPEQYHSYVAIYQGLFSSVSVHPSGLLISGPERELEHEVPMQWIASSKMLASAFDMYTLKKIGLFKLDVLGLKTLDQLSYMEKMSGEKVPNDDYDDKEVLAAFGADLLAEIFQMDGYACREVLKNIRGVDAFEDIIAANTLARPGCAQFTPFYRSGYTNLIREYPAISEVLGLTNGLILYQEQVMEIARILADFNDSEQDDVKEAIKYFRHEVWEGTIEPLFRERCEAKGIEPTNILEAISKMASYTYNRAHAMTYAAIAYKMMWYKIYHPAIFYAATFDASGDRARLVLESHFFGVTWHPADVNRSQAYTEVLNDKEILLGLGAIKGVGPAALSAIATARKTGLFTSASDFEGRVEKRKCNSKVIQALKDSFALASLGEDGSYSSFYSNFDIPYQFLNAEKSQELIDWQHEQPKFRLAGFVLNAREFKVSKPGNNLGKDMARVQIVNMNGSKNAILFPDVWKKAKGAIYTGTDIKLLGQYSLQGDFLVESGYA